MEAQALVAYPQGGMMASTDVTIHVADAEPVRALIVASGDLALSVQQYLNQDVGVNQLASSLAHYKTAVDGIG